MVDFSDQSGALSYRAERLTRRAAALGLEGGYAIYGGAALGWIKRAVNNGEENLPAHEVKTPIAVAGNLFTIARVHEDACRGGKSYAWLADGYQVAGDKFLSRLDGAFALALWQDRERRLILMTDRYGDGKLFYKKEADQFLFSSWLKLLGGSDEAIDAQSVQEFLRFLYITPPRSIYQEIKRIEAGKFLTVSPLAMESAALEPLGSASTKAGQADGVDNYLPELQSIFEASVRRRVGSRRAGVLLSSGVDSATLLAACDRVNPGQVEAFTVGFDTVDLDESNAARAFANCLRIPHATLRFNVGDYRVAFANMAREFDQPFGDPACLPLICAAGAACERVDVLIDGSGSDGLFGAEIPRHLKFALQYSARLPRSARQAIGALVRRAKFFNLCSYGTLFDFDDPEELFITWSGWGNRELEEVCGQSVNFDQSGFYRAFRAAKNASPQQRFDAVGIFPPDDARFEAAAMANCLMALPYQDVALGNFIRRLPQALRFQGGVTKVLLRLLFARYYGEYNDILKKRYFTFPLHLFLADQNYGLVRQFLSAECLARHGLVDPRRTVRWINRYLAGDQSLLFKIWSLLVLYSWLDTRNSVAS